MFVVKYDGVTGEKRYTTLKGSSAATTVATAVAADSDTADVIFIAGYTDGPLDGVVNTGAPNMFLIRCDGSTGASVWSVLDGAAGERTVPYGIAVEGSVGMVYTVGHTTGSLSGLLLTGTQDIFDNYY